MGTQNSVIVVISVIACRLSVSRDWIAVHVKTQSDVDQRQPSFVIDIVWVLNTFICNPKIGLLKKRNPKKY